MLFGVWNRARDHKETILYAIVTIFLLERVRGLAQLLALPKRVTPIESEVGER